MPTPALSLFGFMPEPQGTAFLQQSCVPADPSPAAVLAEWTVARAKLGPPIDRAGQPEMQPIDTTHPHIQQLLQQPWVQGFVAANGNSISFQNVEIDPLLAYQFSVDDSRSDHHCAGLSSPPTFDELLNLGLPHTLTQEPFNTVQGPQSVLLRARSLNVRVHHHGMFNNEFMGIAFGPSVPLLHVVRFNNRCYLHNGFHRTVGVRKLGATHIPCVFRDVQSHAEVGLNDGTFNAALMESNDPPTVAHYTQGRAHGVSVRAVSRLLHVSWAEYGVVDE